MFRHITDWRLLAGSHEFPGPEGGTCINEAAIVAAGFEYKKVGSAYDCPPCFSKPIASFAIMLNDNVLESDRQRLLPFVTRMSGTADSIEVERNRVKHMLLRTIRDVIPQIYYLPKYGHKLRSLTNYDDIETLISPVDAYFKVMGSGSHAYAGPAYTGHEMWAHLGHVAAMLRGTLHEECKLVMPPYTGDEIWGQEFPYEDETVELLDARLLSLTRAAGMIAEILTRLMFDRTGTVPLVVNTSIAILEDCINMGKHDDIAEAVAVERMSRAAKEEALA